MKLLVGMSNLSKAARSRNTRGESARLTRALARGQTAEATGGESVDVTKALRSAQAKLRKAPAKPRPAARRDSLAEAKVAAALREWKPEGQD